jgi:enoyl-CoA hydratase/carnithine racemase
MSLDFAIENRVALIGLNVPETKNALGPEILRRLGEAWDRVKTDDDIRCAILYSAVDDIFCAGMDLNSVIPVLTRARQPRDEDERWIAVNPQNMLAAMLRGRSWDKPVISAVHGLCLTGGWEMVMGTDLRVASHDATFEMREARYGIMPCGGANVYLPRQIPRAAAKEILLTAEPVPAQRLYEWGFLNRVVEKEDLLDEAMVLALKIAGNGPLAVQGILRSIRETAAMDLEAALAKDLQYGLPIFSSNDAREGVRAFKEGRKADFKGE